MIALGAYVFRGDPTVAPDGRASDDRELSSILVRVDQPSAVPDVRSSATEEQDIPPQEIALLMARRKGVELNALIKDRDTARSKVLEEQPLVQKVHEYRIGLESYAMRFSAQNIALAEFWRNNPGMREVGGQIAALSKVVALADTLNADDRIGDSSVAQVMEDMLLNTHAFTGIKKEMLEIERQFFPDGAEARQIERIDSGAKLLDELPRLARRYSETRNTIVEAFIPSELRDALLFNHLQRTIEAGLDLYCKEHMVEVTLRDQQIQMILSDLAKIQHEQGSGSPAGVEISRILQKLQSSSPGVVR